jgi:hypothetical protein
MIELLLFAFLVLLLPLVLLAVAFKLIAFLVFLPFRVIGLALNVTFGVVGLVFRVLFGALGLAGIALCLALLPFLPLVLLVVFLFQVVKLAAGGSRALQPA